MARLHLVFGGELKNPSDTVFIDPSAVINVGIFTDYESAKDAWRAASQKHVDNALMRFFIADLSQLRHVED